MKRVLVVEDEPLIGMLLGEVLAEAGYEMCGVVGSEDDAVRLAREHQVDLAVIDYGLGKGGNGISAARRMLNDRGIGILFVSVSPDELSVQATIGHGLLPKPFTPDDVVGALRAVEAIWEGRPVPSVSPKFVRLNGPLHG